MTKFNIYKFLETRPLSFSAFNSFSDEDWGSPERWYESYILGKRQESPELTFGSIIDKKFQDDPTFLPEIKRYQLQHKMEGLLKLGRYKIPLIGIADNHDDFIVEDLKTGRAPWTQSKADKTKQLTFYALLKYLIEGVAPEKLSMAIHWVPTQKDNDGNVFLTEPIVVQTFKTKRTMLDVLNLMKEIKQVVKDMHKHACDKEKGMIKSDKGRTLKKAQLK